MLYIAKEEKYIRRGSPAAPTEAGVYAYTKVTISSNITLFIPLKNTIRIYVCVCYFVAEFG